MITINILDLVIFSWKVFIFYKFQLYRDGDQAPSLGVYILIISNVNLKCSKWPCKPQATKSNKKIPDHCLSFTQAWFRMCSSLMFFELCWKLTKMLSGRIDIHVKFCMQFHKSLGVHEARVHENMNSRFISPIRHNIYLLFLSMVLK